MKSTVLLLRRTAHPRTCYNTEGFLDIHDPTDFAGIRQSSFSIARTYVVGKEQLPETCDDLYTHVINKLNSEAVGKISLRTTDYLDSLQRGKEAPRRYIVIESNTNRGTRSSIFIRFLPFGDNLYVGIESYVLGTIDWFNLAIRIFITFIPIMVIFLYISITVAVNSFTSQFNQFGERQSSGLGSGFLCCLIPAILFFLLLWIDVLRAFNQHGNLALALRQNISKSPNNQSFNNDDVLMFFKSSLPLVIFSVREVFDKHKLPIKSLEDFATNVNNVVNISTGGGCLSIIGSAIGGRNNNVNS